MTYQHDPSGYAADPVMFYGPSGADAANRNPLERGTEEYAPVDGPARVADPSITHQPTHILDFLKSPAGFLVVALPVAYVLYDRCFGASA